MAADEELWEPELLWRTPEDEAKRLLALRELEVLGSAHEESFDQLTRLGAELFQTPICVITLVDECRAWFKSKYGIEDDESPRSISMCSVAIGSPNVCTVVDATQHQRFHNHPLVTGDPGIRFYAGAPLITQDGYPLGTFCIVDLKPRPDFGAEGEKVLADLAAKTVGLLEARLQRIFQGELDDRAAGAGET